MAISNQRRQPRRPPQRDAYLPSFVIRVHQLLKLGYDRLHPADYSAAREETITGDLAASMQSVLRSREAPEWTADLTVHDEVHIEDGIRRGRRRLRIDIEVEQVRRGPRPVFQFEAKRLRSPASLRAYLGPAGLGRFLDGRYACDQDTAGMLGYVQSGALADCAVQLAQRLTRPGSSFAVLPSGPWRPFPIIPGLTTHRTQHQRPSPLGPITIMHTLLACH